MCSESDCSLNKIGSSPFAIIIIATADYYSFQIPPKTSQLLIIKSFYR